MAIDPVTGMLIGGGLSTILGGLFGGSSASKQAKAERQAAADTRAYAEKQTGLGGLGQLAAMLGPEGIQRWLAQTDPALVQQLVRQEAQNPTFSAEQQARYEQIERELQKPVLSTATGQGPAAIASRLLGNGGRSITPQQRDALEAEKAALWSAAGGRVGKSGIDLEALKALGPGLVGKYRQEASDTEAQGKQNLSRFDAGTYELGRLASDIERSASNYGRQQEDRIRRDSALALANNNALATSNLMGRGLGASTALTGALRGNATANLNATNDALGSLGDQQIRLRTGLAQNRLGLLQSRDAGRNAMMLGGQDAARGARMGALNVEQAAIVGSDASRQLGSMAPTFFSSASPSGQYLGAIGGGLAGAGSTMLGYGLQGMAGGGGYGDPAAYANYFANDPNAFLRQQQGTTGYGQRIA